MRRSALLLVALALCALAPAASAQAPSPKFIGSWTGILKMGENEMNIILNIAPADTGGVQVYYDIPSQGVTGMQIPSTRVAGNAISFPGGNGRYEGTVNGAGTQITGKFAAGGQEVELNFARRSATPTLPAIAMAAEDPDGLAGDFTGRIEAGAGLEATVHLRRMAEGYAVALDIPAQGATGLSASAVTLEGGVLTATFPFGVYRGTFSADRATLDGTWTQGGRELPFDLTRTEG
ncbi:MAG TPA: hypothetical protein VK610_09815 [Rhodothermales bacterium]|nr:hypothetical protein [Rhodothermales bacterium]